MIKGDSKLKWEEKVNPATALHLALNGEWDWLTESLLSEFNSNSKVAKEFLDYKGAEGLTLLHAAANYGKINLFSKEHITKERLERYSHRWYTTVIRQAAVMGNLAQIPAELLSPEVLTKSDSRKESLLAVVIQNNHLDKFPKELLTERILLDDSGKGKLYVHMIADQGDICFIPKELLTKEVVLSLDEHGNSVLFYAARMGELKHIPKEFLIDKNLFHQNDSGQTLLHWAASSLRLNLIAENIISPQLLKLEDKVGENGFHSAVRHGCLGQINIKLLTEAAMINSNVIKGKYPPSPMALWLTNNYSMSDTMESSECENLLKKILGQFSLEGINKLLKDSPNIRQKSHRLIINKEKALRILQLEKNYTLSIE